MQVSMVMILALTGLGCENKPSDASDTVPAVFDQGFAAPLPSFQGSWSHARELCELVRLDSLSGDPASPVFRARVAPWRGLAC